MKNWQESKVEYQKSLPSLKTLLKVTGGQNFILIHDEKLKSRAAFVIWAKQFQKTISISAGEKLKDLDNFTGLVKQILPLLSGYSPLDTVIVAVGGGSIGDCVGFLASVLKRGVGYVNIPSTWLAALDSAHGGKNGMNVGDLKNQIGTYYNPAVVFCVQSLLEGQPEENIRSAYGEAVKMSLIEGGGLFGKLSKQKNFNEKGLWQILPAVVRAKYKIVKRDPYETKGIRHWLNFGHSVGHVFETENYMSHGAAVQLGLEFAAEWSRRKKILSEVEYKKISALFVKNKVSRVNAIPVARFSHRLKQDKKSKSGDRIRFVFLQRPGRPQVEEVPVDAVVSMAKEMGWVK